MAHDGGGGVRRTAEAGPAVYRAGRCHADRAGPATAPAHLPAGHRDLPQGSGLEDTTVYTFSRQEFLQYAGATPQFAIALIALLSTRLRHVTEYAESLAYLDVHARLARILLEMADRYGVGTDGGVEIDFDLTQTDLATMVGATRERVNRALASFRSQGLLELRGRKIALLDTPRLRQRIS
ncbi:MAG: Crp/Fnr family transcriptional regulator [Armatimonadota bacterium]|nr:Crp/Fnr family transcriptional regulator [Armatimonadota bacterium]MDR7450997.1 Crp/Fnr family transcriptional regulator [Armatimonadota bacterium]MDR7465982.1 Crp/Fnr family transcriptional regulator [Armatimonadota bacterium]MDR7494047.1 Crp/Fnr family transcriptional regulator [Armatimonadota bacterium]MDR7498497.1 Crp/Fnr family transcriptional regulator [Armatimonadota bacterium]